MKVLHTSDWHLGRTFHHESLDAAQAKVLEQIKQVAIDHHVDVIVIAGDVYDRAVPPIEAIKLFERTLVDLTQIARVIVTSGNHDSAVRLGFGSPIMNDALSLRTDTKQIFDPILIQRDGQSVAFYAVPYLLPDTMRFELASDPEHPLERSHQAVWQEVADRIRADITRRRSADPRLQSVIIGHAFVIGGEASDSERDITVGGIDSVTSSVFDGIDYVALGHLHGPQEIKAAGDTVITYSGSLLRYSFSEAGHTKSVTIVDLEPGCPAKFEQIHLIQERDMARLEGTLAEILSAKSVQEHSESWVRVRVTDPVWPENLHTQIRNKFPYAVLIEHTPPATEALEGLPMEQLNELSPTRILESFMEDVANIEPDDETRTLFSDAFNRASSDGDQ